MNVNISRSLKQAGAALLSATALLVAMAAASPADAHERWRRDRYYGPRVIVRPAPVYVAPRYYYPPPAYYAPPPPVYYAPPPVYYAPPPAYYAPPPAYYAPRYPTASVSIGIPLR